MPATTTNLENLYLFNYIHNPLTCVTGYSFAAQTDKEATNEVDLNTLYSSQYRICRATLDDYM